VDLAGQRGEGKNGGGRCLPRLGPAQEENARERRKGGLAGREQGRGGIGQRAKMEKRGREIKEFLFFFQIVFPNIFSKDF
jgi:hypothetical protein